MGGKSLGDAALIAASEPIAMMLAGENMETAR